MPVGNQASVQQVSNVLTNLAIQWRELTQTTIQQWSFINKLGLTGLENLGGTGAGFSSAANPANPGGVSDAQYVLTLIDYLATCAQVFQGTQGQAVAGQTAADFNFQDATTVLWAGE